MEKIERRLEGWKKVFLSKGGRLTLTHCVLSVLPVYFLSLFTIPGEVANTIERLIRAFLWEDFDESNCSYLVKWDIVSISKFKGGLGIGNMVKKNRALLSKWLWRLKKILFGIW